MSDLISREKAYEVLTEYYHHRLEIQHKGLREALAKVPTAENITTCEFCKYLGDINYCPDKSGQLDMADYCSWGERMDEVEE